MQRLSKIMRRSAVILLCLVLITTSVVSGTLAKYTTSDNDSTRAQVAKWGIIVTPATGLNTQYTNTSNLLAVKSKNTDTMIAPGVKGVLAMFTVAGSPEVSCDVKLDAKITLGSGYTDLTSLVGADGVGFEYMPIIFKLCVTKNGTRTVKEIWRIRGSANDCGKPDRCYESGVTKLMDALNKELKETSNKNQFNEHYDSNTTINAIYSIEWEWFYKPVTTTTTYEGISGFQHTYQTTEKDTILGEAIAKNPNAFKIEIDAKLSAVQST